MELEGRSVVVYRPYINFAFSPFKSVISTYLDICDKTDQPAMVITIESAPNRLSILLPAEFYKTLVTFVTLQNSMYELREMHKAHPHKLHLDGVSTQETSDN